MLRGEPIVRHECCHTNASSHMANEMPEGLRRTPVEPTAMDVQDGFAGLRIFRSAPPARDASNGSSFVGNASRRGYPLHDGVEGDASGRSLQAPFVGFNDSPHGGHRRFVFRTDSMGGRPGAVLLNGRVHGHFSCAVRFPRIGDLYLLDVKEIIETDL